MQIATPGGSPRTVRKILDSATERLGASGCDEARLHVELLMGRVLNVSGAGLSLRPDRGLTPAELEEFDRVFCRRMAREPLQHILGETVFMGLPLAVNRHVLIPRPETELLAERAMAILAGMPAAHPAVLDVGTGSGNIAIAVAHGVPAAAVTAVDVSRDALAVAAENIRRHVPGRVELVEADVFGDLLPERTFDLLVSNPPYVPAGEFSGLEPEVRDFEPRIALTDGGDGFRFHRRLVECAALRLRAGGALVVEIGYGQREGVERLFDAGGLEDIRVTPDYAGIPRIVEGTLR